MALPRNGGQVGTGWHQPLASLMLRQIGLPASAMIGDLDEMGVSRLLAPVRTSSLSAAGILAHDHVYDGHGVRMEGAGSFYVPNSSVLQLAKSHPEFLPAVSIY